MNKNSKLIYESINFFLLSLFFFADGLIQFNVLFFEILKVIFVLHLLIICYHSYSVYGFFSVYTLFLVFSFFFIYDAVILDIVNYEGLKDFTVIKFPQKHTFSFETGRKFLFYSEIFFFILDFAYRTSYWRKISPLCLVNNDNVMIEKKWLFINKIVYFGIVFVFPFALLRMYFYMRYFREKGYLYVLTNGIEEGVIPSWTNGMVGIAYVLFLLAIINPLEKQKFLLVCFLMSIIFFVKGFAGNRGGFLYSFFAIVVVFVSLFYKKKVSLIKIVCLIFFCLFFAVYVGNTRNNSHGDKTARSLVKADILLNFFANQTNSRGVLLSVLENEIPFHTYPFIFAPLINEFRDDEENRMIRIKETNSINLLTAYSISPSKIVESGGLGGSVIAEFIDCGGILGIVFWGFVLTMQIILLENFSNTSNLLRPFYFTMMSNMMHNPRGYFFGFIGEMKYVFVAIILYFVLDLFYKSFYNKSGGYV